LTAPDDGSLARGTFDGIFHLDFVDRADIFNPALTIQNNRRIRQR